jgi:hypothetical protein
MRTASFQSGGNGSILRLLSYDTMYDSPFYGYTIHGLRVLIEGDESAEGV